MERITDEFLDGQEPDRLRAAAMDLYSLLANLTGVGGDGESPANAGGTALPCGLAISPSDAARCVLDFGRTSKFLKGTHAALTAARARFPGRALEVVYAGCGPFACLAVPLSTRFGPDEVRFTFVDVHARSLDAVRRIVDELGLGASVHAYVQGDAARYVHPGPLHGVIIETMQRALGREPQLPITRNLAPQLCNGGVFIPQQVLVDAWLVDAAREVSTADGAAPPSTSYLGRVFELTAVSPAPDGSWPIVLDVPKQAVRSTRVMLATTVTVFESFQLGERESGITHPVILHDVPLDQDSRIEFRYTAGSQPGLDYRWAPRPRGAADAPVVKSGRVL